MRIDQPEPGYWLQRLVKGGPWVPCAIVLRACPHEPGNPENVMGPETRSPTLVGLRAGRECDPHDVWISRGEEITRTEYEFRLARMRWSAKHAPEAPEARPRDRVDWNRAPIPWR